VVSNVFFMVVVGVLLGCSEWLLMWCYALTQWSPWWLPGCCYVVSNVFFMVVVGVLLGCSEWL